MTLALAAGDRRRADPARRGAARGGRAARRVRATWPCRWSTGSRSNRITSDRTERVQDTTRVIEHHPIVGVGIGGQPRASRRLAAQRPADAELRLAHDAADGVRRAGRGRRWRSTRGCWWAAALLIWRVTRRDQALGLALGASLLGAVRARALLQRLPGGPAHVARARPGAAAYSAAPARRREPTAGGRRRVTAALDGPWILSGVLLALVAITLPELGSDPWHFRPAAASTAGAARAAGARRRRGVGPRHRPRVGASSPRCCAAAAAIAAAHALAAGAARAGPASRWCSPSGCCWPLPSTLLQLGLRDSTAPVVLHERLDLPGRAGRRPRARTADNPYGHDYRTPGLERFYTRDGSVSERVREKEVALAPLRLLPRRGAERRACGGCCRSRSTTTGCWCSSATLALLPAALAFRGPLGWRLVLGARARVQPDRGALGVVRPERRSQPAAARARVRARHAGGASRWAAAALAGAVLLKQFALVAAAVHGADDLEAGADRERAEARGPRLRRRARGGASCRS